MKHLTILITALLLATVGLKAGEEANYPTRTSAEIADTWQDLDMSNDGRWSVPGEKPIPGPDTTDGGKGRVTASKEGFPGEGPGNAFDNSSEKYCTFTNQVWVQYRYAGDTRHRVDLYTLTSANDIPARDPRDWQLLGSNDGESWTVVDERQDERFTDRHQLRSFKVKAPDAFNIYRLNVTRNHGEEKSQISEIQLIDTSKAPAEAPPTRKVEISRDDLLKLAADPKGYQPLFTEELDNAVFPRKNPWTVADGVLKPNGKGDIWTKARYGDFILDLEFKCDEKTNSGVFIRCKDIRQWLHTAIEVQILQPDDTNKRHACGAIYDCKSPTKRAIKPAGEWNHYTIIAASNAIFVWLNDELVNEVDLNQWTEPHKNPDGSSNKFKYAYRDMSREGHIGLQEHGHPIWFRNLRIKPL